MSANPLLSKVAYATDGGSLTQARLKELLDYDPDTGVFTRKDRKIRSGPDGQPGTVTEHGYLMIRLDYQAHYAHRLAWLYVHGTWEKFLDHVDRDGLNNRIANLRKANKAQNALNHLGHKLGRSGYKGVWSTKQGRFSAYASLNGDRRYLGTFDSAEDAAMAHDKAKVQHCGEFAVLNFPERFK